jgi:endonuclease YncB( thermonuclease family)
MRRPAAVGATVDRQEDQMIAGPWRILGILVAVAAARAEAQTVVDGDTLSDKGKIVHLWGIDAPDPGHICSDGWDAGKAAADYLRNLIAGKPVSCEPKATTVPGGPFAVCKVGGQDLGAAMAAGGMAWALPNVPDYSVQASNAMYAISGVYAHPCVKAWEWRAGIRNKQ